MCILLLSSCEDSRFKLGNFLRSCEYDRSCLEWLKDYREITARLNYEEVNPQKLSELYVRNRLNKENKDLVKAVGIYLEVLDFYSAQVPSDQLLESFEKDYFYASTCLFTTADFYEVSNFGVNDIIKELSAVFFKKRSRHILFMNGYYRRTSRTPVNLSNFELGVLFEQYCRFKPDDLKKIRLKLMTSNGRVKKEQMHGRVFEFEKRFGTKYRDRYEKFIQ